MTRAKLQRLIVAATFFVSGARSLAADVSAPSVQAPPANAVQSPPSPAKASSGPSAAQTKKAAVPADSRDSYLAPPDPLTLSPTYASDAPVPIRRAPLMDALNHIGLAHPLEQLGINIYGETEGSVNYNVNDPHAFEKGRPSHQIELRMFDHHSNQAILQRVDLYVDRVINYRHITQFDLGGLVEVQYGHDGAMMHSNGLLDYNSSRHSPTGYDNEHSPYYQPDLTEAYFDVAAPVGSGLRVRTGKFATIMGYESCDPVHNQAIQFYSRSYILTFGIPMYQTGSYATYDITPNITANAGFSRGWEQAIKDNNTAIDFLGSVNFILNDHFTDYVALSEGPEEPGDNAHYRTVIEDIVYYTPDPRGPWNFALDSLLGFEDDQVTEYFEFAPPAAIQPNAPPGHVSWSGLALFGGYRINNNLQFKMRGEWFQDNGGSRFRFPEANREFTATIMQDSAVQLGHLYNVYELTMGVDWFPLPRYMPTLKVRPEVRYDYADQRILVLDKRGDGRHDQTTLGLDILYRF